MYVMSRRIAKFSLLACLSDKIDCSWPIVRRLDAEGLTSLTAISPQRPEKLNVPAWELICHYLTCTTLTVIHDIHKSLPSVRVREYFIVCNINTLFIKLSFISSEVSC
jgi:hypothetical protein